MTFREVALGRKRASDFSEGAELAQKLIKVAPLTSWLSPCALYALLPTLALGRGQQIQVYLFWQIFLNTHVIQEWEICSWSWLINQMVIEVKPPLKYLKYLLLDIYSLHFYHSDCKDFISYYYEQKATRFKRGIFLSLVIRISEIWS